MSRFYAEKRNTPKVSGLRGTITEVLPGRRVMVRVDSRRGAVYGPIVAHSSDEHLREGVNVVLNQASLSDKNRLVVSGVDSDFLCTHCGGSFDMHCGQIGTLEDEVAELQKLAGLAGREADDSRTDLRSRVERLEQIFNIMVDSDDVPSMGPHTDWRTDNCGANCSCRSQHG